MKKVIVLCFIFMLFFSGSPGMKTPEREIDEVILKFNEWNKSIDRLNKVWNERDR